MTNPKQRALNSVDMSQWGGPLSRDHALALWDAGVRNIKVGTGYAGQGGAGSLSRQQASQWLDVNQGRGGTVDAYIYLYFAGDAIQQCRTGMNTLAGIPIRRWWLDAEDIESPQLTAAQRQKFIVQCLAFLAGQPTGIYTAHWWWPDHMDDSKLFADQPLWNSWYDNNPDESGLPYGGWQHSVVEQYLGTTIVGGMSVDLDYDSTLEEEDMGMTADERAEIDAFKRAVFAGSEQHDDAGNLMSEAGRTAYANDKIAEGGQSVNDVANSAMALIQKLPGVTPSMSLADVQTLINRELSTARIVVGA